MKKLFKLITVLTALTVAGFGLTACSDDDDDDSVTYDLIKTTTNSAVVATYVGTFSGTSSAGLPGSGTDTLYCYEDKTWKEDVAVTLTNGSNTATLKYTAGSGTYSVTSGDETNGTITITVTKQYEPNDDFSALKEKSVSGSSTITITNGKFTYNKMEYTKQ